jgi:hypothetical protein
LDFSADFGVNVTAAYNDTTDEQRTRALDASDVQYNVALDMFLDPNATTAATADLPRYEVMIWLSYSYGVYPVGIDGSSPGKEQYMIGDTRLCVCSLLLLPVLVLLPSTTSTYFYLCKRQLTD